MLHVIFLIVFALSASLHAQELTGIVSRVTDGDSFELLSSGQPTRIRLFGIDCPEINQPYGDSAKYFLQTFLADSVSVIVRDIDKYGRTVADVFYRDTLINYSMISNGLAWHYKKYSNEPMLAEAEQDAKANLIGLWKDPNPIAPWDWRSGNYDRSIIQTNTTLKFFICVGKENNSYHTIHFCPDLETCKSSTILVTMSEAQEVYQKNNCPKCIQSTN